MYPKINLDKINKIIDNTEYITDEEKEFYKTMIRMRKERILDFSYEKLVDPFYSDSNIRHLENIVRDIMEGKAHFAEHDLMKD